MKVTRRRAFPLLAAASASAAPAPAPPRLESRAYPWDALPVKQNGDNRGRAILDGLTHSGYPLEMHATELAPGLAPHGAHAHPNDELVIVREGTLEVDIAGRKTRLGPGSVVFVNSGEQHGLHNAGPTRAHYYIIALGPKK
jgi:XRE family transcriptional regulator, regulator of sulfur utilization